jgi:osmotically-inducible protein OsmY
MKCDTQLRNDVLAELKWQPSLDAAHIGVTADNNTVTLTGQVGHYIEKMAAQDAAKRVYGVKAIANDIVVKPKGIGQPTDQDIAEAALSSLRWDFQVPTDSIKVFVSDGYVSIEGNVDWHFQKDAAERCIKYLVGVKAVANNVTIKPSANWTDVTTSIEAAFRRNADMDARRITVETSKGNVMLSGSVSSWKEHDEAIDAAWSAPGVISVSDDLAVAL